jgi:oligogalacturonide lyase
MAGFACRFCLIRLDRTIKKYRGVNKMIGKMYPSEKKSYLDEKTGRKVWQLTEGSSNNVHLYFTDNSFSTGDEEIYFLSDRGNVQERYNFFRMNLESGQITQMTDEPEGIRYSTKTPDSELLVYIVGNQIKSLNTRTGESHVIYEETEGMTLWSPFISPDKKLLGFCRNEEVSVAYGNNYTGFKETMYAIKRGCVTIAHMDGSRAYNVFEDTHWLGHFQFSPHNSDLAMFCHEGPWNQVHQRIWLLELSSGKVKPCFRQAEDDCVGHEFWTRDGMIFFDNRRKGHDGTITSNRTQVAPIAEESNQTPYIGLADITGEVLKTIPMPYYCNHYHANNNNSLLVGDEVDDLVMITLNDGSPELTTLCTHHTSWSSQKTHCHPTFNWKGDSLLFASDRSGAIQLYVLELNG